MSDHPGGGEEESAFPTGTDELVDRTLEVTAEAVSACLANEAALSETLASLRAARLRGETVQDDLESVFDRFPPLGQVAALEADDRLQSTVEAAVRANHLPERAGRQFLNWWVDKAWVADGIEAHAEGERAAPDSAWDRTALDATLADGELVVEHVLKKGVDHRHRLRTPATRMTRETATRTHAILNGLRRAQQADEVNIADADRELLLEARDELRDALETARRLSTDDCEDATDDETATIPEPETEGGGGAGNDTDEQESAGDDAGESFSSSERMEALFEAIEKTVAEDPDDERIRGYR